jgi:hypothetical protein
MMLKLSCTQATRLMSEGQERALSTSERTLLRMHTWICSGCRNFGGQLGFIRQAMKGFADHGAAQASAEPDDDDGQPPGAV